MDDKEELLNGLYADRVSGEWLTVRCESIYINTLSFVSQAERLSAVHHDILVTVTESLVAQCCITVSVPFAMRYWLITVDTDRELIKACDYAFKVSKLARLSRKKGQSFVIRKRSNVSPVEALLSLRNQGIGIRCFRLGDEEEGSLLEIAADISIWRVALLETTLLRHGTLINDKSNPYTTWCITNTSKEELKD